MGPVIDIHTHMFTAGWLEALRAHGGPDYEVKESLDSPTTVFFRGASFCVLEPAHFDWASRTTAMQAAGVDIAIVTMPAPSVFWGDENKSAAAATAANNDFAAAQSGYPERIRWMASLPWEYPDAAVDELSSAVNKGAVGVLTLGNINGRHLTDPLFAPIWQKIDDLALPVLVHPTSPPGTEALSLADYAMVASVGFMVDTTTALTRMIFDGFFDVYPNLKLIAAHAGATLPYLAGRFDRVFERTRRARVKIASKPSDYLRRIYYDSVTYRQDSLQLCIDIGGADKVMYGSDYPFNIGDMEGCLSRVNALDESVAEQVRSTNAARIFGL